MQLSHHHQEDSRIGRLVSSSVSNGKLHCTLIILILFILIFLSIPLLFIYKANTRFVEDQDQLANTSIIVPQKHHETSQNKSTSPDQDQTQNQNQNLNPNHQQPVNCTDYALQANLSLADENVHCPTGTFPCNSCPEICIEQKRQCDDISDCPDESDERCHDGNGAVLHIFKNIVNLKEKQTNQAGSEYNNSYAKPESCSMEDWDNGTCPCVVADSRSIICEQLSFTSVPENMLDSVFKIRMSNNSITNIDHVIWPRSLQSLALVNNSITHIGATAFQTAPILSKLYISHNKIAHIDLEAFKGLSSLTSIWFESNRLTTFDSRLLRHTPAITKIYLSENQIDLPEWTNFGICKNLRELLLDHNRISIVRAHWFSKMSSLIWLSLAHNQITSIEDGAFNWNYDLEELNLAYNRIHTINRLTFAERLNVQRLFLAGNPLDPLPVDAFRELLQLKSLNLTDIDFAYINIGTFSYLTELEFIYFSNFHYCHYANHSRVCLPHTDGLSSSTELLAFPTLKYAVWIVASVCILGNVFVFVWRSISPREDPFLSLFVRNLSIADLLMGIYLAVIGWQDWRFKRDFGLFAIDWMSSATCTAIGFLAIVSSELSVFILTIITIERYRCIMSIKRFEEEDQKQRAKTYVSLAWFTALLIASYPLIERLLSRSDYYATNALCLPLHIDQPYMAGWQYSAFIYLGINFVAVLTIITLYAHMYSMIIFGRQVTRPAPFKAERLREDAILAVRFFFIVVTDCLCWIPIVVIKIMALLKVNIHSSICGWLVVFIIPINSALNPIVYTLAAPGSLRNTCCRLFMRLCYKIDIFGSSASSYSSKSSSTSSSASTSASDPNLESREPNRRRMVASSSSTTCDTFETSLVSHSKASVESTAFASHLRKLSTGANQHHPESVVVVERNDYNVGVGNNLEDISESNDKNSFFKHCTATLGDKKTCNRSYECLSSCDKNGAIKYRILTKQTIAFRDESDQIKRQQQRQQPEDHSLKSYAEERDCDPLEFRDRLDSISWLGWRRSCRDCIDCDSGETLASNGEYLNGTSAGRGSQDQGSRLARVGDVAARQRKVSFGSVAAGGSCLPATD